MDVEQWRCLGYDNFGCLFLRRLENPAALTDRSRKWQKAQNHPGAGKRPEWANADLFLPMMKMVIDILEGNNGNDDPDKRDKNQAAKNLAD